MAHTYAIAIGGNVLGYFRDSTVTWLDDRVYSFPIGVKKIGWKRKWGMDSDEQMRCGWLQDLASHGPHPD
jgi:hypothetical protein